MVAAVEEALQGRDAGQYLEQQGLGESRICLLRQVHIQWELTLNSDRALCRDDQSRGWVLASTAQGVSAAQAHRDLVVTEATGAATAQGCEELELQVRRQLILVVTSVIKISKAGRHRRGPELPSNLQNLR